MHPETLDERDPLAPRTRAGMRLHRRLTAPAVYAVLMAGASLGGFAKTVVLAKVLGATELGYYGLVPIVLPFGTLLATVGTLAPLGVDLPQLFGAGDPAAAGLRDRTFGLIVLGATVFTAFMIGGVTLTSPGDTGTTTALTLSAFTVALNSLFEFYLVLLRARVRLVALASAYLGRSTMALLATAAAGTAFGYRGAILAEIAVLACMIAFIARFLESETIPRRPVPAEATRLIRVGVPLSISGLMLMVVVLADRAFVASRLPDQLGQYTFAAVISVAWFAVTGFVSQAVGSAELHGLGAGRSVRDVRRRLGTVSGLIVGFGLVGLPLVVGVAHALEKGAYSEYRAALEIVPILYAGGALSAVSIYGYVLLALRRFSLVLLATGLGVVVAIVGGAAISAGSPTIADYAWLFFASQVVTAATTVIAIEVAVRRRPVEGAGRPSW